MVMNKQYIGIKALPLKNISFLRSLWLVSLKIKLIKIYQHGSFTIHPAVEPKGDAIPAIQFVEKNNYHTTYKPADTECDYTTWSHSNILFIFFILLNAFRFEAVSYFCSF